MRITGVGRVALAATVVLVSFDLVAPLAAVGQMKLARLEPVKIHYEDIGLPAPDAAPAFFFNRARLEDDMFAMARFRPGFEFWHHVFTIPDGSVAFASASDGRLLATFSNRGDWTSSGRWVDPRLAGILAGQQLASAVDPRTEQVAWLLEPAVGNVMHNGTRGDFLLPNVRRYGSFLGEWGAIYERFGVPAEIGLAQAIIESGLNGTIRSEARALGFCQWLPQNWERLKKLSGHVIEGNNQTSQAPYCAAYLTILAAKHGSFIPALSEHHAGGTNVAKVMINGARLGGTDPREQYFLGSQLALDLRDMSPRVYQDVYSTYGPRSYKYAEMIFGNTETVKELTANTPQEQVYAMRTRRAIPIAEITRRTGLSAAEVRRYNPALVRKVPARGDLYLPMYVDDFGTDVSFWHRPPTPEYTATLEAFIRLGATLEQWNDPSFRFTLRDFERRFDETNTEEGRVMAAVLSYVVEDMYSGPRTRLVADYLTSPEILRLFERGVSERATLALPANRSMDWDADLEDRTDS
jgi:hypothetical protein